MPVDPDQERQELILYLTPEGPLGASCEAYFDRATAELGTTTAQTYPPHVTMTGFFRRKPDRLAGLLTDTAAVVGREGLVPKGAVEVVGFKDHNDWVGLQIRSPWAKRRLAEIIDRHRLDQGDDALRPKDWLHLSLAYDQPPGRSLADFAALASEMVDPTVPVTWRFGVWQRLADGSWVNHR